MPYIFFLVSVAVYSQILLQSVCRYLFGCLVPGDRGQCYISVAIGKRLDSVQIEVYRFCVQIRVQMGESSRVTCVKDFE
ncbi:hypothetical protein M758_10G110900 [Ceratodon purpureus]|uniref:Secreted protein n=1 Tax=Ceratodon purpureus TaxID=3225 RepID=A0A8T0GKP9_CERPU|nr:hypothetical protein KC19_10G114600 [Ceratodon purpureus]KAG0603656.1 hypothetical protein M758_10G110900 [Ceratodon purpureus]